MKTGSTPVLVMAAFVLSAAMAAPVAAFQVVYNYYAYATGSDGIPIADNDVLEDEWYFAGDHTKTGAAGNYGTARFYADLSTATVSAFACTHGVHTVTDDFFSGTGRVERIDFEDHLLFTVPAGFYEDGVQVSLLGRAQGTIFSEVGASASARCYLQLGGRTHHVELQEIGSEESGTIIVDEDLTVTVELVSPGSTLNQAEEFREVVRAAIRRAWTSSNDYNPGSGRVIGDAEVDFEDGLRILAVQVPPGVGWTSESGLFPGLPSSVPGERAAVGTPRLDRIHPNPFNPQTTISFTLDRQQSVRIVVHDLAGRRVAVVADRVFGTGSHVAVWGGRDAFGRQAPSGAYVVRLEAASGTEAKKVVLIR